MKSIAAIAQCRASQEPEKNLCKAEFFCREAREESACSVYRKTHLFDAFSWKESDSTLPGEVLHEPVNTPLGKAGLGTCYDLRFPEPARIQALKGAEVLIYPSAWVDGPDKFMQWEALLRARAIENTVFTIGCCHYSEEH